MYALVHFLWSLCHCVDNVCYRSRGYAFILYACPSAVDEAQEARPHELDGKVIDTKRCLPKGVSLVFFIIVDLMHCLLFVYLLCYLFIYYF